MRRLFGLVSSLSVVVVALAVQTAEAAPECGLVVGGTTRAAKLAHEADGTYTLSEHVSVLAVDGELADSQLVYQLTGLICAFDDGAVVADCRVGEQRLTVTVGSQVLWEVSEGESTEWSRSFMADGCKLNSEEPSPFE